MNSKNMPFKVGDKVISIAGTDKSVRVIIDMWEDYEGYFLFHDDTATNRSKAWGWVSTYFRLATPLEEALS